MGIADEEVVSYTGPPRLINLPPFKPGWANKYDPKIVDKAVEIREWSDKDLALVEESVAGSVVPILATRGCNYDSRGSHRIYVKDGALRSHGDESFGISNDPFQCQWIVAVSWMCVHNPDHPAYLMLRAWLLDTGIDLEIMRGLLTLPRADWWRFTSLKELIITPRT